MQDYTKMQEEWLKNNKPKICPTIDNGTQKTTPLEPIVEEGLEGFVEEILEEKEPDKNSIHEEDDEGIDEEEFEEEEDE